MRKFAVSKTGGTDRCCSVVLRWRARRYSACAVGSNARVFLRRTTPSGPEPTINAPELAACTTRRPCRKLHEQYAQLSADERDDEDHGKPDGESALGAAEGRKPSSARSGNGDDHGVGALMKYGRD
jgi:hypothetical protein